MNEFTRIAVDTSKAVFTLHGVDGAGVVTLRRELRRSQFEAYFAKLGPTEVVMEACGGSHHWARRLTVLGHRVKLIAPQYVKAFVKRGKNDRNDAAAICTAAGQPDMRFVAVKSAEQQAELLALRLRDLLVRQRTQLVNALRGHASEFGLIAAKGTSKVAALLGAIEADPAMPEAAKRALRDLGEEIERLDDRIAALDQELLARHKANPVSQRLEKVPGLGPVAALSLAVTVDAKAFLSGRHFAAWLGLTPKERSTGGRQRMAGISRAGNERLRQLLVLGATAVIRYAKPGSRNASAWLLQLLERKPRKLVAVALANKMARIAWAMMVRGEAYRQQPANA